MPPSSTIAPGRAPPGERRRGRWPAPQPPGRRPRHRAGDDHLSEESADHDVLGLDSDFAEVAFELRTVLLGSAGAVADHGDDGLPGRGLPGGRRLRGSVQRIVEPEYVARI